MQSYNEGGRPMTALRPKKRLILRRVLLLLLLITASILFLERNLTRVTLALAQAEARTLAQNILGAAANAVVQDGVPYDELMIVTTDAAGRVRLLQANTAAMNDLSARASAAAQQYFNQADGHAVQVPLGAMLGLTLLAGAGPEIDVQVLPVGSVSSRFDTEFESAGINQTRHRILLTLTAVMRLVIPTGASTIETSTQVAVAESIIIGEVPESFVDVADEDDLLELIP